MAAFNIPDKHAVMRKVTQETRAVIDLQLEPMAEGGIDQREGRASMLFLQPVVGSRRKPALIRKTWCQSMENQM